MKRTIFIGQAMPRAKKHHHDWPTLNAWLYSIGITLGQIKKIFFYSALVDYFPGAINGSHKVPTSGEIQKERDRLIKTIKDFEPELVVPVGKKSIGYCLDQEFELLKDVIGKTYFVNPYKALDKKILVVPLPHPSGASTWYNQKGNKELLKKALRLLERELA
jgi:uracil-DNA glycosylase